MPDLLSFSLQRKPFMKYQQPLKNAIFFAALQVDTFFATCCCLACKHTIRLKHNMNSSHSYYTRTHKFYIGSWRLFLLVIRLFWRYTHPAPQLPDSMSPLMKTLAHLGHLGLYFMLIAIPITGCLFSWSVGKPVPVLYLFEIPALVDKNPELLAIVKPVHTYLSWFAGAMVVGHMLAALKHHFIDKNDVLRSMTQQGK